MMKLWGEVHTVIAWLKDKSSCIIPMFHNKLYIYQTGAYLCLQGPCFWVHFYVDTHYRMYFVYL